MCYKRYSITVYIFIRMSSDIRSFFTSSKKKIRYEKSTVVRPPVKKKPKQKQVTLESLGRVVVIEEFERCKG